jgi:hypothetical protein
MTNSNEAPFPLERLRRREDTADEVEAACADAASFLRSHEWCGDLHAQYFAGGEPENFTVHLFDVEVAELGREWLWVCRGKVPSAYLDDSVDSPQDALDAYGELMEDWVSAVRGWGELDDCYPVELEPSEDAAAELDEQLHELAHGLRAGLLAAPEES